VGRVSAQSLGALHALIFAALNVASGVDLLTGLSAAAFARCVFAWGIATDDKHDTAIELLQVVVILLLDTFCLLPEVFEALRLLMRLLILVLELLNALSLIFGGVIFLLEVFEVI
jgi:F0F1-type ATP synthase assembly protein I